MSLNSTPRELSTHLCECGCGQFTNIASKTDKRNGWVKGQPSSFVRGHNGRRAVLSRFWEKVDKSGNCWIWTGTQRNSGYGQIGIGGKLIAVHRYIYEFYNGTIPEGICVLHHCDTRCCVRPSHLFLGTKADNMFDMVKKGRGTTKLTEEQVTEIRRRYAGGGVRHTMLAAEYGVSESNIRHIIRRNTWKHIP
jgi:hypothetical protein